MRSDRLLGLLMLLQTRGRVVADDAARELEVSTRTIYRDMDALSAAGVPVYTERGRRGGCSLLPGWRTDLTGLSHDEARSLFAAIASGGGGLPGGAGPLAGAVRKLMAALPESQRPLVQGAKQRILVDTAGWRRSPEPLPHLGALQSAVFADRRLQLRYRHSGDSRDVTRTVDPYGLVVKAGTWYLVAAHRGEPRLFRVSRVRAVQALDEQVRRTAGLDLAQVWRILRSRVDSTAHRCDVTVLVVRERREMLLRVVAAQLVDSPRAERNDAPGWVRLVLPFRAPGAARGVLLGLGGDVRVLSPAAVREDMVATARTVLSVYAAG